MVGKFYEKGFGIDKDINKAFEWYMEASKQKNYNGIFEVGNCYYNGYGVVKNFDVAFEYFERAVNDSKEELNIALYSLASCYKSGDGIRKKNESNQQLLRVHQNKAFELYKKSAENGFVQSQYELAECYKNGIGILKNNDESSKWDKKYKENAKNKSELVIYLILSTLIKIL
jgi:TPR repeat protein